jgi:hypothetical protein
MENDLFIFDLDGTLVMTEHIHHECWNLILNQVAGVILSYSEFCNIFHTSIEGGIELYLKDTLHLDNYSEIIEMKNNLYIKLLKNEPERFLLNDGCDEFLRKIVFSGKSFIIVTNSRKYIVDRIISLFPVLSLSSRIYSREDLYHPKPNLACFNQVLNDFPCKRPVIFEDSLTGMISANGVYVDVVFVNIESYTHYEAIVRDFHPIKIVKNFLDLNDKFL